MVEYDVHVATQETRDPMFEQELSRIGFTIDPLVEPRAMFPRGGYPLLGTHMTKKYSDPNSIKTDMETARKLMEDMTKKYSDPNSIKTDMETARKLMEEWGQIGYIHGEVTSADLTILSKVNLDMKPWPIQRFGSQPHTEDKKWDIHIAIPEYKLPPSLEEVLHHSNSGLYYISLLKNREGVERVFRAYTIQGINSPAEGRKLFEVLTHWFCDSRVPYAEMKQETYVGMFKVGSPRIIPPTIREIHYNQ